MQYKYKMYYIKYILYVIIYSIYVKSVSTHTYIHICSDIYDTHI